MMKTFIRAAILAYAFDGVTQLAAFQVAAPFDNADQGAYSDGWQNADNGGSGFDAWTLTTTGTDASHFAGFFIGSSTDAGGNNDTNSKSFGIFANPTGASADAVRTLSSDLAVGKQFTLDMVVNFRNGNKGFDLRDSSGATLFNLNVGSDAYTVNNAVSGNGPLFGNTYDANTVFSLAFEQTSLTGGSWTVTRSGGQTGSATGSYNGLVRGFKLYVQDTDAGGAPQNNLYANNFAVVPEPSAVALLLAGSLAGGCWLVRRRA